jgi:hypothetical protein
MEMKKWTMIFLSFLILACDQRTFTLDEVKGTYYEVETKHSKWNKDCSLIVSDSTVTLRNCRLLKDLSGDKIRVVENRLGYHMKYSINEPNCGLSWRQGIGLQNDTIHEYYTSFKIFKRDGIIHLYQPVETSEGITFRKIK